MEDVIEKAESYKRSCLYQTQLHYMAADTALRKHYMLGIPVVITTTLVTTSIFATLNSSPSIDWKITAGVVSLVGTVLSALHTFLRFSDRATEHKAAATNFRALSRRFDVFILRYSHRENDYSLIESALNELEKLAEILADLSDSSPHVTKTADIPEIDRTDRV